MGWIMRKYTHPTTKTKRVRVKREVRLPLPRPQQMRIWRWLNKEVSDDGKEPTLKSVIGVDGLREFIMLPEWTVNNFVSTIKENHFKTLRDNFQIPDNISIHLSYESEKCYYEGVQGVGVYEQMLKAGLRFLLSSLHRELLKCLGLFVNQVSPNAWRVFIKWRSCTVLWLTEPGDWQWGNSFTVTVRMK